MSNEPNRIMYRVRFDIPGDRDEETVIRLITGILPRIFTQVSPDSIVVERKDE